VKDIHDVIKLAKFGDDRLKGSGIVAGQISAFPIDFAGRPYNTLTLPCERVISCFFNNTHLLQENCVVNYNPSKNSNQPVQRQASHNGHVIIY